MVPAAQVRDGPTRGRQPTYTAGTGSGVGQAGMTAFCSGGSGIENDTTNCP